MHGPELPSSTSLRFRQGCKFRDGVKNGGLSGVLSYLRGRHSKTRISCKVYQEHNSESSVNCVVAEDDRDALKCLTRPTDMMVLHL